MYVDRMIYFYFLYVKNFLGVYYGSEKILCMESIVIDKYLRNYYKGYRLYDLEVYFDLRGIG